MKEDIEQIIGDENYDAGKIKENGMGYCTLSRVCL
jgi:hypothetical protein